MPRDNTQTQVPLRLTSPLGGLTGILYCFVDIYHCSLMSCTGASSAWSAYKRTLLPMRNEIIIESQQLSTDHWRLVRLGFTLVQRFVCGTNGLRRVAVRSVDSLPSFVVWELQLPSSMQQKTFFYLRFTLRVTYMRKCTRPTATLNWNAHMGLEIKQG